MRSLPAAGLLKIRGEGFALTVEPAVVPGVRRAVEVHAEDTGGHAHRRELGADRRRHEQAGEDRQASRAIPHIPSREKSSAVHTLSVRETRNFAVYRQLCHPAGGGAPPRRGA